MGPPVSPSTRTKPCTLERAVDEMMRQSRFGDAGASVVIEEWMRGEEASYYAICDGERYLTLAAAQSGISEIKRDGCEKLSMPCRRLCSA